MFIPSSLCVSVTLFLDHFEEKTERYAVSCLLAAAKWTTPHTLANKTFTNSTRLISLSCDFLLLCSCRACTSSQPTTACTWLQGRPKGWVPVAEDDGPMKQRLLANDCASFYIVKSLADRCKKIHAGDEVIQVNHQTVVRLFCTFFLITTTSQHWYIPTFYLESCFCYVLGFFWLDASRSSFFTSKIWTSRQPPLHREPVVAQVAAASASCW